MQWEFKIVKGAT